MIVYLDPQSVDVTDCAAVVSHVRGRLLAANLSSLLMEAPTFLVGLTLDDLPTMVRLRLQQDDPDPEASSVNGLYLPLDSHALVWHNLTAADVARRLSAVHLHSDLRVLPGPSRKNNLSGWGLYLTRGPMRGA